MSRIRRVVFDTSTLVSAALRFGSIPYKALVHAIESFEVCASQETLAELERVLRRKKFDRYLDAKSRGAFVALMRRHLLFVPVQGDAVTVSPPCRDAEDAKFLALALAAEADAVVSSDEDLLVLHPVARNTILTPADFLVRPEAMTRVEEGT